MTTEKDRVRKVAERFVATDPLAMIEVKVDLLTRLILKEIKRAERREREANAKLCEVNLFAHAKDIASAIRNRRKV